MPQSRQLAAIMFTDIAGYTALMEQDEQMAFDLLKTNRQVQRPLIESHGGRWIKELGDGVMATFTNVTDAVLCAGAIQQRSKQEANLKLRIGIHLGEVIFEDNDVFGDGVNVASRIQHVSPIGGICISESVQKNLSNKKGISTRLIGEETFRNVSKPVCLYEATVEDLPAKVTLAIPVPATAQQLPIVDKSIAVLAFLNMSNDPEQEYFSDGIAEEILNLLTRLKDLKVVARSSSFQYKGKNTSPQEIGEKLGVSNVLEGSIRKQGNRLRITTQLINSAGGYQLWSERYDREADDIFAIQDEIALAVTEKLKVTFYQDEKRQITTSPTENLEAYELYLKGRFYWNKRGRSLASALPLFLQAITIDPYFAKAYAGIADTYSTLGMYGVIHPKDAMPKAREAALKAMELAPSASEAFTSMGYINGIYENDRYMANKNFQLAIEKNPDYATGHAWYSFYLSVVENDLAKAEDEGRIAMMLEPYNAVTYHITGLALLGQRRFADALALAEKAMEFDTTLFLPYFLAGWCLIEMGNYQKAIEYLNTSLNLSGRHSWPLGFMTMAQARIGNTAEAEALFQEITERDSTQFFSVLGSAIGASAVNNIEKAVWFLEKGFENKDPLLPIFLHLTVLPDNLRNDNRFLHFLRKTKLIG